MKLKIDNIRTVNKTPVAQQNSIDTATVYTIMDKNDQ